MKLSFKKGERATGLTRIAYPNPITAILGDGRQVGSIHPPHFRDSNRTWAVTFYVKKEPSIAEPASFQNTQMKKRFETEPEARIWIRTNWNLIQQRFDLYRQGS